MDKWVNGQAHGQMARTDSFRSTLWSDSTFQEGQGIEGPSWMSKQKATLPQRSCTQRQFQGISARSTAAPEQGLRCSSDCQLTSACVAGNTGGHSHKQAGRRDGAERGTVLQLGRLGQWTRRSPGVPSDVHSMAGECLNREQVGRVQGTRDPCLCPYFLRTACCPHINSPPAAHSHWACPLSWNERLQRALRAALGSPKPPNTTLLHLGAGSSESCPSHGPVSSPLIVNETSNPHGL